MRRKRRSRTRCYTRAPDLGQPRAARYPPDVSAFSRFSADLESSAGIFRETVCSPDADCVQQKQQRCPGSAVAARALRRAHRPTSRFRQTRLGPPSQIRLGEGSFHTHRRHRPRRAPSLSEASVAAHVKNVVQSRHLTFGDKRTERRPRRGLARQLTGTVPNVLFPIHRRPTSSAP